MCCVLGQNTLLTVPLWVPENVGEGWEGGLGGGGVVIPLATSCHLCTNNFTFVGFDHIILAVDCHGVIQNLERVSHWSIHQYPCMQYAGIPHSFLMSVFTA